MNMRSEKVDPETLTREYYNNAYDYFVNKGDIEQAIAEYNKVIQINPDFANAYYDLGFIYNQLGKRPETIIYFSNYLRCDPQAKDRKEIQSIIDSLKLMDKSDIKVRYSKRYVTI